MVNVNCWLLLAGAVVTQSHAENKNAPSDVRNLQDDKAYRIAVGEKYFASLDDYDRDSWIDPYNMFDYETEKEDKTSLRGRSVESNNVGLSERVESERPAINNVGHNTDPAPATATKCEVSSEMWLMPSKCKQNEYIYITRWLRKFLRKMNYSPNIDLNQVQTVQFPIFNHELHEISKFLDSKNVQHFQDVESIFDGIVARFHISHPESSGISDVFYFVWENSTIILIIFLCIISLWRIHVSFHHHHLLKMFIILTCFVSIIWTWIYLYQKETAKQQATLHSSGYPEECQPISFSFTRILKHFWKATIAMEDVCTKYYEAQIVDPFWKITPLMVISETISNFVLQPLGSIASHCNTFWKNWYSDMSLFMVILATCFGFIMLLMLCRYSLRLPFSIITIEPRNLGSSMDRLEFLPFRNTDEHEIAHDQVQSAVSASPQHGVHSDFNAAGDHINHCHDVQQEHMPLEMLKLPTSISLKDQSSQTDEL